MQRKEITRRKSPKVSSKGPKADEGMSFDQALKLLNIEDYKQRIWNSNSHGELFHIFQYVEMAKQLKSKPDMLKVFRSEFEKIVKYAEENWKRPQSVFQHIMDIFSQ